MKDIALIMGVFTAFLFVIAISLPFLSGDSGSGRFKALQARRDEMRREATSKVVKRNSFRESMMEETMAQKWVKKLNLMRFVDPVTLRAKLSMAGWRQRSSLSTYLLFRLGLPILFGGYMAFLVYGGPLKATFEGPMKHAVVLGITMLGFFMPTIMLKNAMQKRDNKLTKQFPDALDLLLVCVEAGLSMDMALIRVTEEIGDSIPEVSEEFAVTAAELAYLGDRGKALDNFATRTMNADFKALSTVLIQAEKQGAPIADAIRTISTEARETRKMNIEKKAAGLGPKMTVPMILFILPCMFLILIGPSVIKIMNMP